MNRETRKLRKSTAGKSWRVAAISIGVALAAIAAVLVLDERGSAGSGHPCPGAPYRNSCLGTGIVRSKEVKDGSLGVRELSRKTVAELRREGSFSAVRIASSNFEIPPGATLLLAHTVQCAGGIALSGGLYFVEGNGDLYSSYPSDFAGNPGGYDSWTVEVTNSSTTDPEHAVAFVVCAPSSTPPRGTSTAPASRRIGSLPRSDAHRARRVTP